MLGIVTVDGLGIKGQTAKVSSGLIGDLTPLVEQFELALLELERDRRFGKVRSR